MKRDDLLEQLSSFPADVEIGVRLGSASLDISDVSAWGKGQFVALDCHQGDVYDLMSEWGIPADRRDELTKRAPDDLRLGAAPGGQWSATSWTIDQGLRPTPP